MPHVLLERITPPHQRSPTGAIFEVKCRLPGRISGPDEMQVQPMGSVGLATGSTVIDALPNQALGTLDGDTPPCHTGCEDHRPRSDALITVEHDLHLR